MIVVGWLDEGITPPLPWETAPRQLRPNCVLSGLLEISEFAEGITDVAIDIGIVNRLSEGLILVIAHDRELTSCPKSVNELLVLDGSLDRAE